jgi:phage repressor protein C with HTH and peptisase S24 domain
MLPTYQPGDTLLGWRWFRPRAGQVVVARQAGRPLIKRVARLEPLTSATPGGAVWLLGDNPAASTDSRHFGAVDRRALEARIILRLG